MFCCNLHFWQSGLDLLWAAAVTQGLNAYGNKKLSMEEKILLPLTTGD